MSNLVGRRFGNYSLLRLLGQGGFADVYTVFAKVDGDKFTGFIIERGFEGFTQGPEEHKMGIKGSSTRQVYFEDAKVPVENLLGEIHKGYKIAFNILNIGRLKLGAGTVGGARSAMGLAAAYSTERKAFGKFISSFGMIQKKLEVTYQPFNKSTRVPPGTSALKRSLYG